MISDPAAHRAAPQRNEGHLPEWKGTPCHPEDVLAAYGSHAVCELEEGVVHVVSDFPAGP